jgi:outer membrane protein assembly factor BamB
VAFVSADEEVVFVQATSGMLTAFDAATGKRLWAVQLGRRDQPSQPAISRDDIVLSIVGMQLNALDKWSGNKLWEITLPRLPSTSPTLDDERVYFGTLDGSVFAYDLAKINELYQQNRLPRWSHVAQSWRFKTSEQVTTPPISTGKRVFFASLDASLYAVDAATRRQLMQFETDAPISAPLAYDAGYLYMASEDFNLYCIQGESGRVRWQARTGLPVRQAPVVLGPDVVVLPLRGGMHYLSAATGEQRWWRPEATEFIAGSLDNIYASDASGHVMIIDHADGAPLGAIPLPDFEIRVTNDRTDRLFLSTTTGLLICLRETGLEFPLYHKYPERRPILPDFVPEGEQPSPIESEPSSAEPAAGDEALPDSEPAPAGEAQPTDSGAQPADPAAAPAGEESPSFFNNP